MKKYTLKSQFEPVKTKIDYQKELNEEQYKVIANAHGPCLVLAGAGSGKTRTLVYLTAFLLEHKIPPQNIMLVTFTNKAAREMLNRVEVLLKFHPKGLWGGTFHHLGNRILRKYAKAIGYENNFAILDSDDAKNLVKSCMAELKIDTKKEYFPKADLIHSVISFTQNSLMSIKDVIENKFSHIKPQHIETIEKIEKYYQQKKKASNSMDFDDLLHNWWLLLKNNPDIQKRLAAQFQYILVDEYQDTNSIQGEIVRMLSSHHKNIVAVGDDSQSIYSFRAANINNILEFPKKFSGTQIFKLETNYRSSPEILTLANRSIQNNQHQYEKQLKSIKKKNIKPALVALSDSEQQADFITQRILELQEEGIPLSKMAVLFRAAHQALELELELNKRSIPYEMRGGIRFFEQAHIKDVIAYLRAFNNMKDELSWKRLVQLYPGIGPSAAQTIWEQVEAFSNIEQFVRTEIHVPDRAAGSMAEIKKVFQKLLEVEKSFIATAIEVILRSGYKNYVHTNFENAQDRLDDLEQLANFALAFESLDEFLSEVTLSEAFRGETGQEEAQHDDDSLILSTIHQAKGLEWKVVFLIGLVDGQFPHHKVFEKPQEMEEERRLFYVASTRAEDELYLTYPIISMSFRTGQNINRPSTFIKEIDEDLFEPWEIESKSDLPNIEYLDIDI